jgi:DNA-binding NarL/FixJ family response regulator
LGSRGFALVEGSTAPAPGDRAAWRPLVRSDEPSFTSGDSPAFHARGRAFRIITKGGGMAKVLIVDDHPLVARYTKAEVVALQPDAGVEVAGTLAEAEALIAGGTKPDYILFDLMLPDCDGLAGVVRLRRLAPDAIIGVVTGETSPEVMRDCFFQGAKGYLTKDTTAEEFTDALRKLFDNGFFYPRQAADPVPARSTHRLTPREAEVLRALAIGKANKQLAPMLNISESTFKTYLRNIYEKLGVRTRVEAVRRGEELGVVDTRRRR